MAIKTEPVGRRLSDQAHRKLRQMLLRGHLDQNTKLSESDLCRKLGMGRTPIREALLRLEADGLVENTPHAGFRVRHLTLRDCEHICEIRIAMETLALRLATDGLRTKAALERLRTCCDSMAFHGKQGEWQKADTQDYLFHQQLIGLAQSRELKATLRASQLSMFTCNASMSEEERRRDAFRSAEEHRQIIDALVRGDVADASEVLTEHLRSGFHRIQQWATSREYSKQDQIPIHWIGSLAGPVKRERLNAVSRRHGKTSV